MKGYVKNVSAGWIHIFKHGLAPNGTLPLDTLYKMYGTTHGLAEGDEFVEWLQRVKLRDRVECKLVYTPDTSDAKTQGEVKGDEESEVVSSEPKSSRKKVAVTKKKSVAKSAPVSKKVVPKKVEEDDDVTKILKLSAIKAKEQLPRITNLATLKDAYRQARQLPNRDTLCLLLNARITELEQLY